VYERLGGLDCDCDRIVLFAERGVGLMQTLTSGDPQQVGQYRLLKRLGSGGMGQVYLGQSPNGRPVAVKVIRAEHADNADFRQRFRQEVRAARRVSGLFTAAVVDADPDAPRPWMVTAFVSGPSLAAAVTNRGPLSVRTVRVLAAGLAEGLSEVHAAGLVHRDLKPANVLLASDGPRIIDFGISRPADSADPTRTGGVIGSPGFMSPEQAMGDPVGPASDIFCLGSVLAYAATGEPPFGAGPASALLYRVVFGEASTVNIPTELRLLIAGCLVRDPAARPTTDQLLAELGHTVPAAGWLEWQDSADASTVRFPSPVPSTARRGAARETCRAGHGLLVPAVPAAGDTGLADTAADTVLTSAAADVVPMGAAADAVPAASAAEAVPMGTAAHAVLEHAAAVAAPADLAGHRAEPGPRPAGHRGAPKRHTARRPPTAGPRHRRPEPKGKQAAIAAACAIGVVITGTLALSLLSRPEPGEPAAGQAATESSGAHGHPGRQQPSAPGHGQAQQATAPSALPANGASAPSGPGGSAPTSHGQVAPTTVVLHYFAAVDHGNWAAAWALGGDNLYPNRAAMVAGYADQTGQNVTVVSASGDTVVARVQTTSGWGLPEAHTQQFVVKHSVIVARGPAGFRY
jgi:Protein kinase domain